MTDSDGLSYEPTSRREDADAIPTRNTEARSAHRFRVGEPVGEIEITLARIWADVLGIESIERQDDFFDLGGNSLGIIMVLCAIDDQLGLFVELGELFSDTTLAGQAEAIEAQKSSR